MYFGHGVIQAIADGLPAWANAGLNGVAALLPALGFALLLNIIFEKDLTPYLIIGFVLAAYAGQAITMVGITLIAFAIAMIIIKFAQTKEQLFKVLQLWMMNGRTRTWLKMM